MLNWYLLEMEARHRDRVGDLEKQRLIHEALAGRAEQPELLGQAMIRLGGWLVGRGKRLQAHYGARRQIES